MAYNDKREAKASVLLCFSFYLASALLGLTQVSGQQIPVQPPPYACDVAKNPALANFSFCNKALPIDQRVADLVNRMNLTEKVWSTVSTAPEITRLGIPKYEWWSEALHGVSNTGPGVRFGNTVPGATSFPMPILTAASFNMTLVEAIGKAVSTEGRAMYNLGQAGLTYWSPTINIYRDPRWGRAQETPGEDPYLNGKYAAAYVRGLQQTDGGDANKLKVAACCKHYTAYDVDKWNNVDRFHFNALVTKQDLEDTFNPPFKACVLEGNVASVMCSYNQVNGKPTCADQDLLEGIIRGQWKLNGYIVSDCDSLEVIHDNQHYSKTPEEAAAMSIKAGLDLDCGKWTGLHGELAVKNGLLNESLVNRAVTNNFATLMRLGFFDGDPKQLPYGNLGAKDVCNAEHQELGREAARQGIVLLKNDANSLPLNRQNIKTLAVIGPNANATRDMIGNYEGIPCSYISPFQGLTALASSAYAAGCADIKCATAETEDAIRIAASSDATVIVVGTNLTIEAEGLDRTDITLPGQQQKLVTDVAAAAKGPVILVIMAAGSMDISFAKTDSNISSILWVGFPGQHGGGAIADVIFGLYNPSGRLPMTWYPKDYITNLPMTTMNLRADLTKGYAGRTYRFYKGEAVYKFGDGLSYTRFKYRLGKAPQFVSVPLPEGNSCRSSKCTSLELANVPCKNLAFEIQITVKNIGAMDGSNSVLLFVTPPAMFNAPQKQLVAFQKVYVKAKSAAAVTFNVDVCKDLNLVDEQGNRRVALGQYTFQAGNVKHTLTLKI